MLKLLTGLSPASWAIFALVALLAFGGTYALADHRGYQRASMACAAQIATMKADAATAKTAELERQDAASNAAKAAEAARIAEMQAQNESLEQKIEELQREADQDPDAGRTALGADSVRRINAIR